MSPLSLYLTTVDDEARAQMLASKLVESGLAACVSISAPMQSVYRWQGRLESATERLLLIKAAPNMVEALGAAFASYHPYQVPELLELRCAAVAAPYAAWALAQLTATEEPHR